MHRIKEDLKRIQSVLDVNYDDLLILLHRLNLSMLTTFNRTY